MNRDPNVNGKAYALTILSPIMDGFTGETAFSDQIRSRLLEWNMRDNSPMTSVPQTYLCRYFVLDDVYTESLPGNDMFGTLSDLLSIVSDKIRTRALPKVDHLKSKYLVFSCNFHGDLDSYLRGMWHAMEAEIREIWGYCYAFAQVNTADDFIGYMKKCQINASLFFVGSDDNPLDEQLKALYIKQELSRFAMRTQGFDAAELKKEYLSFIKNIEPENLSAPSWKPGQYRITTETKDHV
ncbi:MAG TPA: hypothetical protein VF774_03055 [Pseudoduganella sp.]